MLGERPNNALQLTGGEGGARALAQGGRARRAERRPQLNAVFCGPEGMKRGKG
jgi:hypothetical protein